MVIDIDPVIFSLGPLQVRWYGLMYVIGFLFAGKLQSHLAKKGYFQIDPKEVEVFLTYVLVGMFVGARLAFVFIYNWDYYQNHLDELLAVWKGGLSFHGAICGMIVATSIFAKKRNIPYLQVYDVMALSGTPGLFFGRMGNFINGELYGRATDVPWAMIFPNGGPYPRHPSQLYEGILEGIVLCAIMWFIRSKTKYHGRCSVAFLIGYGAFRFFVEFFREPDSQLGYYFGGITMGQILCSLMILSGLGLWVYVRKKNIPAHI